jgi:formylglycine-generating enzyme required for sulfatase activity
MRTLNFWLLSATATLLAAGGSVSAQTPSRLDLRFFAGVNITGAVGSVQVIQSSPDPTQADSWTSLAFLQLAATHSLFVDTSTLAQGNLFYRAVLQVPPTNLVFIRPSTFALGSPTNEVGHRPEESPQTLVTISHGFWMGKHEVTQREYLDVVGSNPSQFTGDLSRPVETVSWPEATNYCALLTAQQLAAGRIPPGSRYRLPTEAEWEYAARAGTSTRFGYGEDPAGTNLLNYAWYSANSGARTHPVEQKAPNPWGLFDMAGNVYEWCLDWQGPYPGGLATDPQGPDSNPIGVKIIRGGAWDEFENNCRSATRNAFGVSPFLTDFILGFRVVLACP